MKRWILILMGVIAMLCSGCQQKPPAAPTPAAPTPAAPTPAAETPAAETPAGKEITGLRFEYDMYAGDEFCLNAYVEDLSSDGARLELRKRVGPMNSTGRTMEGELTLDARQAAALLDLLGRYDLAAWSALPTRSAAAAPSRSLIVFSGTEKLYDIPWNARFPETLPPQEDVMYCELFNFFNDLVSAAPGWETVRSENLSDPRDNPAYAARTVRWFGRDVELVPGTGTGHEDGRFAEIDYAGKAWWTEEGFVGRWTLDREHPTDDINAPGNAELTVSADGTALLSLDGEDWPGRLSEVRRYLDSAGLTLERDGERRPCEVETPDGETYARIHIRCYPGPYPEEQFPPIDVYLLKQPGGA